MLQNKYYQLNISILRILRICSLQFEQTFRNQGVFN